VQHDVRVRERVEHARVLCDAGLVDVRLRVVHANLGARLRQAAATVSDGELRVSSVPGLNVAPSTATRLPAALPPRAEIVSLVISSRCVELMCSTASMSSVS